jgi:hypothetical protein
MKDRKEAKKLYLELLVRIVSAFPKASRSGFDCNTTNTIKSHTLYVATLALARDQDKGVASVRAYK